jgi:polysaccharide deacetylase family protein (PEP-CTERM system associated)
MDKTDNKKAVALSVDVEDGISIAMRDVFGKDIPQTDRVVSNTERILSLLEKHDARATFFTLGQVAEHFPALVKKIHSQGHEIGVHGYDHYRFDRMDPKLARDQLSRAKALLEDLTGSEVAGHRAPAFSVNETTKWALPLLAELGFRYDSSIMPCKATHYGWPEFPKSVTEIQFGNGSGIYEIPMSTIQLGTREVPCLGGSYFRLFPYRATQFAINRIMKRNYPVFYMHPYETDPERYPDYYFKELENVSFFTKMKMKSMWLGRKRVLPKMNRMLKQHDSMTMIELLEIEISNGAIERKEYESVVN